MMANARKGKVTGGRKGKGASNRGGSNGGPARLNEEVVKDGEDVLVDADGGVWWMRRQGCLRRRQRI